MTPVPAAGLPIWWLATVLCTVGAALFTFPMLAATAAVGVGVVAYVDRGEHRLFTPMQGRAHGPQNSPEGHRGGTHG